MYLTASQGPRQDLADATRDLTGAEKTKQRSRPDREARGWVVSLS